MDVDNAIDAVSQSVDKLKSLISDSVDCNGLPLLQIENDMLLQYLLNLVQISMCRANGRSDDAARKRLVTLRLYLEKVRPVEQRLRYKIDKYIALTLAEGASQQHNLASSGGDHSMFHRPDPSAMDESGDDGSDNDHEPASKSGKYVVPKHVPVRFTAENDMGGGGDDDDDNSDSEVRQKRKRLSRTMLEELKAQHLDTPEEIGATDGASGGVYCSAKQNRMMEKMRERVRFEEENFVRLPITKADRKIRNAQRRGLSTVNSIGNEIIDFGRNKFGDDDDGDDYGNKRGMRKHKKLPLMPGKRAGTVAAAMRNKTPFKRRIKKRL